MVFAAVELAGAGTLVIRSFEELAPKLQRHVLAVGGPHRLVATCYANGRRTPERCVSADVLVDFSGLIEVPTLRERSADLPELAVHLAETLADHNRWTTPPLTADEMARLRAHDWPGNVRELASTLGIRGLTLHHGQPWDDFAFLGEASAPTARPRAR